MKVSELLEVKSKEDPGETGWFIMNAEGEPVHGPYKKKPTDSDLDHKASGEKRTAVYGKGKFGYVGDDEIWKVKSVKKMKEPS